MKRILLILLLLPVFAQAQIIVTIAGNNMSGFSGDGGQATAAMLASPVGVTIDGSGNLFIADYSNNRIRKVNTSGVITTIAGNGSSGYSGDNGPATAAKLNSPTGVAVDGSGNLFICDEYNSVIRKINTSGIITTIAGNNISGYNGDGIAATAAKLNLPIKVIVDGSGNLFIADNGNNRIRKVNTSGMITTVAGNGTAGYSGDGTSATNAMLAGAIGVAVDGSGNLFIVDNGNNRIRKVNTSGIITTIAGTGAGSYGGDGGAASAAQLNAPTGITIDGSGGLYIADGANNRVRKIKSSGIITTIAGNGIPGYTGDGGMATAAELNGPTGLALDGSGNLFIAQDFDDIVRKVIGVNSGIDPISFPKNNMIIYPNPTTSRVTISASGKITQLTITNLLGQTVYTHEYNTEKVQVDVTDLPTGVYFIKINGTEVRKFVKK